MNNPYLLGEPVLEAPSEFWNFAIVDLVTALLTLLVIITAIGVAIVTYRQNNRFYYETIKADFSLLIKMYGNSCYICLKNLGSSEATIKKIYWNSEILNKDYNVGIKENKKLWESPIFSNLKNTVIAGKQRIKYKIDLDKQKDNPFYKGEAILTIVYDDIEKQNLTKVLTPFIDGNETSREKPNANVGPILNEIKDILAEDLDS